MGSGVAVARDGVTRPSTTVLDTLFGALADPTRRLLVERLLTKGPATATALAEATPLTRQAILKHLQVLEAAGLVDHERCGREVRFRVTPKPLASAVAWIVDTAGQWDQRLARLGELTT
jgi:DNA-binding transcriptional ArsR family regulator